jgi:hypothetical protein
MADNNRYVEFKAEIVNDVQKGTFTQLTDLNKVYLRASCCLVRNLKESGGGAT